MPSWTYSEIYTERHKRLLCIDGREKDKKGKTYRAYSPSSTQSVDKEKGEETRWK